MASQLILISCLLLLLTALIILGLCALNWRLYVALYRGKNLSSIWCCENQSSVEERTAVVERKRDSVSNPANTKETPVFDSIHLEQMYKLKKWHLSHLSSQSTAPIVNTKESTNISVPAHSENNNIYEDINTVALVEVNHFSRYLTRASSHSDRSTLSNTMSSENDSAAAHYASISDDYLDQSSIHSTVRVTIPASSSPMVEIIKREHAVKNSNSWKLPLSELQTYDGFGSSGMSCIYFNPEPDYEDSGLPETFHIKDTLEKQLKEIP